MRIISGKWRSRNLKAPKGDTTRPTADRTREALFSMLISRIGSFEDLAILDLFAGSGALGLEALSRGGTHCTFVEQDPAALKALEQNIETLSAGPISHIRPSSALTLGKATRSFDVIFLDPPYQSGAAIVALEKLNRFGWIAPSAWISVESERREIIAPKGYNIETERNIGKAKITLLRPDILSNALTETIAE